MSCAVFGGGPRTVLDTDQMRSSNWVRITTSISEYFLCHIVFGVTVENKPKMKKKKKKKEKILPEMYLGWNISPDKNRLCKYWHTHLTEEEEEKEEEE